MKTVTLIPGDGIGPEISDVVKTVFKKLDVPVAFEEVNAGKTVFEKEGAYLPDALFESLEKNKLALKGPITTPIGHGFRSVNVELRKRYDLYQNIRPIRPAAKLPLKFEGVDMVLFRENTEDLYAGIEEVVSENEAHSIKIITREKSERIIRAAFEYAVNHHRKSVTVVTKANIMKATDGLFLNVARDVARAYDIPVNEVLVDNMAMQMVMDPSQFDVIVTENLYGDILSDLGAGLIGGLGMIPGVNKGDEMAIYESVHGSAPDIAGKGVANPTAMLLSACLLLDDIDEGARAEKIRRAIDAVLSNPETRTKDLGGTLTTKTYTDALLERL
ncbi:MAG: isocitrate/isopropylmalate dehydrogenase family protein [Peptoniphilus sp.]|nr:isocitrate/isopropylmalate dehydrogenase family protein [Peptoniphilus sp.]MDD7363277.1 isocitrate/isopropylmalate dehydrogenase family protein [Bacillota bacterium]MDY6045370.1 isocitrate/isopropylmalate dehydrogenase family protein [Peptoniphilus sp.]